MLVLQQKNLTVHHESVHEGKKPNKCIICTANLNKHISTVHKGRKAFECNICDTSFGEKGTLKRHIAIVHEEKKPFKEAFQVQHL